MNIIFPSAHRQAFKPSAWLDDRSAAAKEALAAEWLPTVRKTTTGRAGFHHIVKLAVAEFGYRAVHQMLASAALDGRADFTEAIRIGIRQHAKFSLIRRTQGRKS